VHRQPIYVSLVVFFVQVVILLAVFECGRRNETVASVFDRRRLVTPDRCPPPLRQKRGCCNGWLGFEWWRVKLSDEEYKKASLEEFETIRRRSKPVDDDPMTDEFLREAEQQCYRESPFYDPLNEVGEEGTAVVKTEQQNDAGKLSIVESSDSRVDNDPTLVSQRPDSPKNVSRKRGSLFPPLMARSKSNQTGTTSPGSQRSVTTWIGRNVPGTNSSVPARSVRFDDGGCLERRRSTRGDDVILLRSSASERLARLRYAKDEDESHDWDVRICTTTWRFFKHRVLMMDRTGGAVTTSQTDNNKKKYVVADVANNKVTRRPLTKEQQELLRCVGLDAFMTLQFLDFGARVSFWPSLLSVVTLIPVYRTAFGSAQLGFFSVTVLSLADDSWRFGLVGFFAFLQYLFILRQIWILWEMFLPLRYDFLENGDFNTDKYKEQYRKTCVVEDIPTTHRHDQALYMFFDAVFPGYIKRAEVLLNTENLRSLLLDRSDHIKMFEEGYARKVHVRANYLRAFADYNKLSSIGKIVKSKPSFPKEPKITVHRELHRRHGLENRFFTSKDYIVRDAKTYRKLDWHHEYVDFDFKWSCL